MTGHSRIEGKFAAARADGRATLIAYLTAGDPNIDRTVTLARALESGGADILELGVPFSDPIADGPTLQQAAQRALQSGTTPARVFECARRIRQATDLALILFSYANPLLAGGFAKSMRAARGSGLDGVLLTDVPPEESREFVPIIADNGLAPIFLVSPTSTPSRMREAAHLSRGFLYVVSRRGTTGERKALPADLGTTVDRARRAARRLPIAVGFGIADPRAARQAARLADGVVVGSALVAAAAKSGDPVASVERLARALARACRTR